MSSRERSRKPDPCRLCGLPHGRGSNRGLPHRTPGQCRFCPNAAELTWCGECKRRYYRGHAKRYSELSPEQRHRNRVRAYANTYERRGKLVRPRWCQRCGERPPTEKHHRDYSRPLDVEWLCQRCHHKEGRP